MYLEWNILIQDVPKDMVLQACTKKKQRIDNTAHCIFQGCALEQCVVAPGS